MSLHLLSFRPDFTRLMALAARERLLPPGGDLGYALHAVFSASFGELHPKPFRLFAPGEAGGGPAGRLLAYSSHPLAELRDRAATFADPAFSNVLALDLAEDKPMPTVFTAGTRLGFSLRVRPVQRTGASRGGDVRARERDVYRADLGVEGEAAHATRARVYADWVGRQLSAGDAAVVERCEIASLSTVVLLARDRSADAPRTRRLEGPDAVFTGRLAVGDPAAFAALLGRGVGRFRAFGFGMILLRPPT